MYCVMHEYIDMHLPSSLTICIEDWLVRVMTSGVSSRVMVNVSLPSALLSGVMGILKHTPSGGVSWLMVNSTAEILEL